jgi:hypothetical protein
MCPQPANLAYAWKYFSLNFEAIKKSSIGYLCITKRSVSTRGIRKQLSFGGWGIFAQK